MSKATIKAKPSFSSNKVTKPTHVCKFDVVDVYIDYIEAGFKD